ncbi:hypothetical protein NPIL_320361 [Nephila pilipes]|uniref:Uncharacterized protein n=1 Tax=Nephila pilipes TaxID=299642 RepID=A0A8X6T0W1_NEPPI|nr:hypothetical protein NPIL_320361 [Nephila pilipes]
MRRRCLQSQKDDPGKPSETDCKRMSKILAVAAIRKRPEMFYVQESWSIIRNIPRDEMCQHNQMVRNGLAGNGY